MNVLIPKSLREELQKALGFLQCNNPEKAVECMIVALRIVKNSPLPLKKSVERKIQNFLAAFAQHPRVSVFLEEQNQGTHAAIPYHIGKEAALSVVLSGFLSVLKEQSSLTQQVYKEKQNEDRLKHLFLTGKQYLSQGAAGLAVSFFERILQEFPNDTAFCLEAGQELCNAHLYSEAAQYYDKVIAKHETLSCAYTQEIALLMQLEEFAKAEAVFLKALHVFGDHPTTLLRLALLYETWGKNTESLETVERSLALDSENAEALLLKNRLLLEERKRA